MLCGTHLHLKGDFHLQLLEIQAGKNRICLARRPPLLAFLSLDLFHESCPLLLQLAPRVTCCFMVTETEALF